MPGLRIAAVAAVFVAPVFVATASGAHAAEQCFYMSNIQNSRAADDHTVYIRVGVDEIYRMDMQYPCTDLQNSKLIVRSVSGSGQICKAVDVDLKVGDQGFRSACVARSITRLTPDEAAALPRKIKP
jgi:hypothetical protein